MKHANAFLTYGLGLLALAALLATACSTDVADIRGADTADSASVLQQLGLRSGADSSTTPGSNATAQRQPAPDSARADTTRADSLRARQGRPAGDSTRGQNTPPDRPTATSAGL